MFHALVRPLIDAAEPLIVESEAQRDWPRRPLELTTLGRRARVETRVAVLRWHESVRQGRLSRLPAPLRALASRFSRKKRH